MTWRDLISRHFRRICRDDDGVALIVAMLVVSMMSVMALETLQSLRYATRMSVNVADREQSRLYALGAETFAGIALGQMFQPDQDVRPLLDAATREVIRLPIDGGLIEVRLSDGGNCFNLNALVQKEEGNGMVRNEGEVTRLTRIFGLMGIPDADGADLANGLVDWIDTDARPEFGGAEDDYYLTLPDPFRAPNQFIVDLSEIRSIPGMSGKLLKALGPLVCVRPSEDLSPLNVNSIDVEDAPLLAAYLGEEFSLQDALDVISARPLGGFLTMDEFWALKTFASRPVPDEDKAGFALTSEYYDVEGRIWRNETALGVHSTLQISSSGEINTVSRRFGIF